MAKDPMSAFEIPADMRNMAERSVEQAKQAFEGFVTAVQQAANQMQGQAAAVQAGAADMQRKAMSFAQQNIAASFDFAQKLARARDVQELMRLQTEFVQAQMRTLADQAKELGADTAAAASAATSTARKGS